MQDNDFLLVCCASELDAMDLRLPVADEGAARIIVEHTLRQIERESGLDDIWDAFWDWLDDDPTDSIIGE